MLFWFWACYELRHAALLRIDMFMSVIGHMLQTPPLIIGGDFNKPMHWHMNSLTVSNEKKRLLHIQSVSLMCWRCEIVLMLHQCIMRKTLGWGNLSSLQSAGIDMLQFWLITCRKSSVTSIQDHEQRTEQQEFDCKDFVSPQSAETFESLLWPCNYYICIQHFWRGRWIECMFHSHWPARWSKMK